MPGFFSALRIHEQAGKVLTHVELGVHEAWEEAAHSVMPWAIFTKNNHDS